MAKDLFSNQSAVYATYRPGYPKSLYDYVFEKTAKKQNAWDCATGNGQVAVELASAFGKVFATDISSNQITSAIKKTNIEYSVQPAEKTNFPDQFFDLVTVAQAYHWFNFADFEKEVRRVSKPGATIAIWGYHLPLTRNESIDASVNHFYKEITGPYWDPERKWVDDHYQTIPFPYQQVEARSFMMHTTWTKEHFIGFFKSWSSVQHYIRIRKEDPVPLIQKDIEDFWPEGELKEISFPLFIKTGRVA